MTDARWEATVEPYERWGPFSWYITVSHGLMSMYEGRFAWTCSGAERKAKRWVRRLNAADDRKRGQTFKFMDGPT